jgi:hypothetical protein
VYSIKHRFRISWSKKNSRQIEVEDDAHYILFFYLKYFLSIVGSSSKKSWHLFECLSASGIFTWLVYPLRSPGILFECMPKRFGDIHGLFVQQRSWHLFECPSASGIFTWLVYPVRSPGILFECLSASRMFSLSSKKSWHLLI